MKNSSELKGVIVPVITPVDGEDRVDEKTFRKIIRHVADAGVHGIFVGGSAGEGPLLVEKEWMRMVEIAFDENKERVHLLGGVSDTSTKKVLTKVKVLERIGYKNFVVTPTFYITIRTPGEFSRLFGECKESAKDMEMIAYNIPQMTGSEIPVEILCEMVRSGWIKYCKESSGNMDYFKHLATEGKQFRLKIFMGDERFIADGLVAGAGGIVPVCANYEPETYIRAYNAVINQDMDELFRMQEKITFLREKIVLAGSCWIAGIKYAVAKLGMGSGKPVSPLESLTDKEKKTIDEMFESNKIEIIKEWK